MNQTTSQPPAYSPTYHPPTPPRRGPVLHRYTKKHKNGKQWFTLEVSSMASSPELPATIAPGRPVAGSVSLNLDSEMGAKSVVVSLTGVMRTPFGDCKSVERTAVLWSQDVVNVAPNGKATTKSSASRKKKLQLEGENRWPFSLTLPSHVELVHNGVSASYPLPATFGTRWTTVFVEYILEARIKLGGLQFDHVISKFVYYVPVTMPGDSSIQRQLSYRDNAPLIGPLNDPDGWETLDPVIVEGTLFRRRTVQVQYQLSLAKPCSYTRGTVIPLYVTIQCEDMQALDLLSRPGAISIWLCWSLSLEPNVKGGCFEVIQPGTANGNLELQGERPRVNASRSGNIRFEDYRVQSAAWSMLPVYDKYATDKRELQGEIHLASNLPIPTHLAGFHFQYNVSMYAPKTAGFCPTSTSRIQTVDVDICTMRGKGPRPIEYLKRMYDEPVLADVEIDLGHVRQNSVSPFSHVTLARELRLQDELVDGNLL